MGLGRLFRGPDFEDSQDFREHQDAFQRLAAAEGEGVPASAAIEAEARRSYDRTYRNLEVIERKASTILQLAVIGLIGSVTLLLARGMPKGSLIALTAAVAYLLCSAWQALRAYRPGVARGTSPIVDLVYYARGREYYATEQIRGLIALSYGMGKACNELIAEWKSRATKRACTALLCGYFFIGQAVLLPQWFPAPIHAEDGAQIVVRVQ